MRTIGIGSALVAIVLAFAASAATAPSNDDELLKDEQHFLAQSKKTYTGGQKAAKVRNMAVVGQNNLGGRGFNADVWVHEGYAYVGHWGFSDWTNGSKTRFCPSPPKNGIAVVDATDPASPVMVSRLVNPTGTSAEDVTVFTAQVRAARRARHRGSGDPGLRRFAARPELPARADALRRNEPGEPQCSSGSSAPAAARAAFTSSSSGIGTTSGARSSTRPCPPARTRRKARRAASETFRVEATSG